MHCLPQFSKTQSGVVLAFRVQGFGDAKQTFQAIFFQKYRVVFPAAQQIGHGPGGFPVHVQMATPHEKDQEVHGLFVHHVRVGFDVFGNVRQGTAGLARHFNVGRLRQTHQRRQHVRLRYQQFVFVRQCQIAQTRRRFALDLNVRRPTRHGQRFQHTCVQPPEREVRIQWLEKKRTPMVRQ
jgi:hypothetical protein